MRLDLVCAVFGTTAALLAVSATAAERSAAAGPDVTIVGPLENGAVKISGTATVSGSVAATQAGSWSVGQSGPWNVGQTGSWAVGQSGAWSVALEGPSSAALQNIDAATAGLRYDADGNLKVAVGGAGAGDPSVATRRPFGFSLGASVPGDTTLEHRQPAAVRVSAYSFHSSRLIEVRFTVGDGNSPFGFVVPAGQSIHGSFHHAILADRMDIRCPAGDPCIVTHAVAALD